MAQGLPLGEHVGCLPISLPLLLHFSCVAQSSAFIVTLADAFSESHRNLLTSPSRSLKLKLVRQTSLRSFFPCYFCENSSFSKRVPDLQLRLPLAKILVFCFLEIVLSNSSMIQFQNSASIAFLKGFQFCFADFSSLKPSTPSASSALQLFS